MTCNIYNPKLLSAIFSCSPEGIINSLITKFESGKSMLMAVHAYSNRKTSKDILKKAYRADKKLHNFRINVIKGRP